MDRVLIFKAICRSLKIKCLDYIVLGTSLRGELQMKSSRHIVSEFFRSERRDRVFLSNKQYYTNITHNYS